MKTSINQVIEEFNALVPEEQEFVADIIQKIIVESRRDTLSKRGRKATHNFQNGNVKKGSVKDMFNDLEND